MFRRVVVLDGLWRPGASMRPLARRLARAGFSPELFTSATVRGGPDEAIPRLVDRLRASPAHVVAHSLGGLVALAALHHAPDLAVGRVACLGSPLRGSAAATAMAHHAWGSFALGRSAGLLRDGCVPCASGIDVGVVAGRRPHGLGQFLGHFRGESDGTVAVAETRIDGLADHVTVDASHLGLLFSAEAADQALAFLREGRFVRQPR